MGRWAPRETLDGEIKTYEERNFGFFSVNSDIVKEEFSVTFRTANDILKSLRIPSKLVFCDFFRHNGNSTNCKVKPDIDLCILGPHISLWMDGETLPNSASSIISRVGQRGTFLVHSYHIMWRSNAVLFLAKGKQVYNY